MNPWFAGFLCGFGAFAGMMAFWSFVWPVIARRIRRLNPTYVLRDHCGDACRISQ